jgi:hypothetical protein
MLNRILNSVLVILSVCFFITLSINGLVYLYYELIGVKSTWYFHTVHAPTIRSDLVWTKRLITFLCLIELGLTFTLCIFSALSLYFQGRRKAWRRLILIWLSVISGSWFVGSFILALFLFFDDYSVGTLYLWYDMDSEVGHFMFAIFLIPFLVLLGLFLSKQFMKLANSRYWLKTRKRRLRFAISIALIPYLLGVLLYLMFIFPIDEIGKHYAFAHLIRVGAGIFVIGAALVGSYSKKKISLSRFSGVDQMKPHFFIAAIAILVSIYLVWYVGI